MSSWRIDIIKCKACDEYAMLVTSGPTDMPCPFCMSIEGYEYYRVPRDSTFILPMDARAAKAILAEIESPEAEWFHNAMATETDPKKLSLIAKQTAIEAVAEYLKELIISPFSFNGEECKQVVQILENARDL